MTVCMLRAAWVPETSAGGDIVAPPSRRRALQSCIAACVSSPMSGTTALAAPEVGPFWAGVPASTPLIAAAVALALHVTAPPRGDGGVARFLRGYAAGLIGRRGSCALCAALLAPPGVIAAVLIATAIACMATLATAQVLQRRVPAEVALVPQRAEH